MEIHRKQGLVYKGEHCTISEATKLKNGAFAITTIDHTTGEVRKVIDTAEALLKEIPGDPFQQKILKHRLEQL